MHASIHMHVRVDLTHIRAAAPDYEWNGEWNVSGEYVLYEYVYYCYS